MKMIWPALLLLSHCSLFAPETTLQVRLPELPGQWQAAFGSGEYSVLYLDSATGQRRELITHEKVCTLILEKENNLPVLAFPPPPLRPAGGIFPHDLSEQEELHLTWEHGPIAQLLFALREQGFDPSGFNCRRLAEELDAEQDPWRIDLERIAAGMISGSFRVTDIHYRPSRSILLPFYSGTWSFESPFRQPQAAGPKGLLLESVSLGYHTLIRDPLAVYALQVGKEEVLWRLRGLIIPP